MAKVGRNQPCPCGSGKKYKRCCMGKKVHKPKGSVIPLDDDIVVHDSGFVETGVDRLSNLVVDLLAENRVDEAEKASMRLLKEYPEWVDGLSHLAKVHKAKGNFQPAADYARRAAEFMREREGEYDPELIEEMETQQQEMKRRAAEQSS